MGSSLNQSFKCEAITAIIVVESRLVAASVLTALDEKLAEVAVDQEIVVVANGVPFRVAQELRDATEKVANLTVHFLAERVDRDTAVLVGIDQALGDWLVILTPTAEEVASLPRVLEKAGAYEIVFAGAREPRDIPAPYRIPARIYFKLYRLVSGWPIDWPAPRIRVYSRAAARYLASLLDGDFALRSLSLSGAFPGTREHVPGLPSSDLDLPSARQALRRALRGLINGSAVSLRAVVVVALSAGAIALLSSAYAVLIYLLKEDVAPGWTTLSLQISLMTLLFSVMFALVAEYVLHVYRALGARRRIPIVREIRSPLRRDSGRLNVIGTDGHFQLGAPRDVQRGTANSEGSG
jgi:hypothetical protein